MRAENTQPQLCRTPWEQPLKAASGGTTLASQGTKKIEKDRPKWKIEAASEWFAALGRCDFPPVEQTHSSPLWLRVFR
jgi:hypothetical protein